MSRDVADGWMHLRKTDACAFISFLLVDLTIDAKYTEAMRLATLCYANNTECEDAVSALRTFHPHFVEVRLSSLVASETIDCALNALADEALSLWPHWYSGVPLFESGLKSVDERLNTLLSIIELCRRNPSIELSWLKRAVQLAAGNKRPRIPRLVGELEAGQLALAIGRRIAGVALIASSDVLGQERCDGFPRAVEWLARECGLHFCILLPASMKTLEGLAPVLYNVREWSPAALREMIALPAGNGGGAMPPSVYGVDDGSPASLMDEEPVESERIVGKPHHNSPGEKRLAEYLVNDPRFKGLFGHNRSVTTRCGRTFLVDLLWPEGMMVVEIDGYRSHREIAEFTSDRDRDYRLMISGYRVLRLTHDEVMRDTDLALEKINDVVLFIHSQKSEGNHV